MAIYHLSAQVISRGSGHSAVHAAAYRARCELHDARTGLTHDYSRKAGELLFEGIYAPKDAPEWAHDRAQLWNHVEAFEKHRRAELAREFNIALPSELTLEQNRYALQDFVRDNFVRKGLIADVAIHAPDRDGDQRNIHAHIMVVMRKLDGSEFIRTKERFETYSEKDAAKKAELEALRTSWERTGNRHLERHGFEPTLDRRSLLDQGIVRDPTIHLGKEAMAIEREGKPSELGDINREIAAENERRVIDLAAERAMRDARAAAKGQVDEIRTPDHRTAAEAVQPQEARAAASAPEQATPPATEWQSAREEINSPSREEPENWREAAPARDTPKVIHLGPPTDMRDTALAAEHVAEKVSGRILGAATKLFEAGFNLLMGWAMAPPPLTKQQAHDKARSDNNVETLHAQEYAAGEREKEAAYDWQAHAQKTAQQEKDLRLAQTLGRPATAEANVGREHDQERERDDDDGGRERER